MVYDVHGFAAPLSGVLRVYRLRKNNDTNTHKATKAISATPSNTIFFFGCLRINATVIATEKRSNPVHSNIHDISSNLN